MTMRNHMYNVPLIPPDLRREETVKQIADSLEHLEKIADDIFSKISKKVGENKARLNGISQRAAIAQAKIDKLKGSNKATKVFCSPKYPHSEEYKYYEAIFKASNVLLDIERSAQKITAKHQHLDDKVLKEKLHFYNLHWNFSKIRTNKGTEEGLGRLPNDLKFVSSLLLFNTAESPYQKYVMLDPLRAISKTKKTADAEDDEGIGAAPLSIAQGEQLERQIGDNFFYQPGLGHVPEIDVPVDLPYLPGIADDMAYVGDIGPTIAPSVPIANLPVLPDITPDSPFPPSDIHSQTSSFPPPPLSAPSLPPPPPPPAPPTSVPATQNAAPPPPPPPPPIDDTSVSAPAAPPTESKLREAPKPVTSSGDARLNLLESIRQAGGKAGGKLRNVESRKIEAKKKKQEAQAGVPEVSAGDLMSDLFNKLALRRKGISGAKAEYGGSDDITDSSSRIPPPPKPGSADETSDSDWD